MGEACEVVTRHEELFNYLHQLLMQIEEQTGELDLELREKIQSLSRETMRPPSTLAAQLGDTEIAQELDKLSAKLDSVEERIFPSVIDPQVQSLLNATADLWMPTITASSQERVSIACASSNSELASKETEAAKDSKETPLMP